MSYPIVEQSVALKRGTGSLGTGVFLLSHRARDGYVESSAWLTLSFFPVFPLRTLRLEVDPTEPAELRAPGSSSARVRIRAAKPGAPWRTTLGVYATACAVLVLAVVLGGVPVFFLGRVSNMYLAPAVAVIGGFLVLLCGHMDARRWRIPLTSVFWRSSTVTPGD